MARRKPRYNTQRVGFGFRRAPTAFGEQLALMRRPSPALLAKTPLGSIGASPRSEEDNEEHRSFQHSADPP